MEGRGSELLAVASAIQRHMRTTSPGTGRRNYGAVCPLQSAGYRAAGSCAPWPAGAGIMSGTRCLPPVDLSA